MIDASDPNTWTKTKLKEQYKMLLECWQCGNTYRGIDIELRLALYRVLIGY